MIELFSAEGMLKFFVIFEIKPFELFSVEGMSPFEIEVVCLSLKRNRRVSSLNAGAPNIEMGQQTIA